MAFVFQDYGIINNRSVWRPFSRANFSGRLLVWATYRFDAWRHGLSDDAWRETSLLIHVANGILLLSIAMSLMPVIPAIVCASLFLAHPLTIMSSSYVAGRSGSLVAMCHLVGVLLALRGMLFVALLTVVLGWKYIKEDMIAGFPLVVVVWLIK